MPENKEIRLVEDTIDKQDLYRLKTWLSKAEKLTQGPVVERFERAFGSYLSEDQIHAVMVNSGSSALLVACLLVQQTYGFGAKVVVPALSWATDLAPVMQLGLSPILVDCNLSDLSLDLDQLEQVLEREKPKALICVSVLGIPPNMERIVDLCEKHKVLLIEDACESLGSELNGRKIGSFGSISTFSFFYGHHISTIEGGAICSKDKDVAILSKMARAHGWARDLPAHFRAKLREAHNVDPFNEMFTFYMPGFNLRSTDLNAFIGLEQLRKLDWISDTRHENFMRLWTEAKLSWKPTLQPGSKVSALGYPIIVEKDREPLVEKLRKANIECRPIIAGSMSKQPMFTRVYDKIPYPLKNAELVHTNGLYIPCHQMLDESDLTRMIEAVDGF